MVQLLVETVSLSGAFVKTTALAVACLWPDWGRESIIGGWCSSGFAAREKGTSAGIGLFAAKWVDGSDGLKWLSVMGYWLLKGVFGTMVVDGGYAAPARPNHKNNRQAEKCIMTKGKV